MKNNKGITLIALIITIIVMLILVGVTVSVVINSNLIGTAQGAKTNTELKYEEEQTYGMNVTINGENYVSVEDFVNPGDGAIKVAETPTHVLHVFGTQYLIDSTTEWSDLETCEEPIVLTRESYSDLGDYFYLFNGEDKISGIYSIGGDSWEPGDWEMGMPFLYETDSVKRYNDTILQSHGILIDLSSEDSNFDFWMIGYLDSAAIYTMSCRDYFNTLPEEQLLYAVAI